MCLSTMWGPGGGGNGKGGSKQRFAGLPSKQIQHLVRELQVLSREHTIELRLDMKGMDRPEFAKMRQKVIEAGGILEIELATFLTNVNPDLIAAMNGKFFNSFNILLYLIVLLFLHVGQCPGFFADGTCAPMQFSNQFTAQEFQQHLDYWGIDAVLHVHPDMLPYRGCDEKSEQYVRFTAWLNCLQKDFDEILRISNLMKACSLWVYRYVTIVLSSLY